MHTTEQEPDRKLVTSEAQEVVSRRLLQTWLKQISQNQVSSIREPMSNQARLLDLLQTAISEHRRLVFVAIGCQDWIKPEWGDPETDAIMGQLTSDRKRPKRFAQEMADFSRALRSFNVPHIINFSLSDIEARLHFHLQNMGVTIHNPDLEVLNQNVATVAHLIQENGGLVQGFVHSEILQKLTRAQSWSELQYQIAESDHPTLRQFLDKEYALDLSQTANHFVTEADLGPVWLDIQSFNYEEEVLSLQQTAEKVAPNMPMLTLFPNAGNWRAKGSPPGLFPTKQAVVTAELGLPHQPQSNQEWFSRIHRARDEKIMGLLSGIVGEEMSPTSSAEKTLLDRLLIQLVFGFDPLAEGDNHAE